MTTAAALHLLGLQPGATVEEIGRAYAQKRSELAASEACAPTPGLKAKNTQRMADLDAAFTLAMQAALTPRNFPTLQPVEAPPSAAGAAGGGGASAGGCGSGALTGGRPPVVIPAQRATRKVPVWAIAGISLAALALAGGIWLWMQQQKGDPAMAQKLAQMESELKRLHSEPVVVPQVVEEKLPAGDLATASKDKPFTNTLGMKFVRVPGTDVLFCQHETRVADFRAFVAGEKSYDYADGEVPNTWTGTEFKQVEGKGWDDPGLAQGESHPVTSVSWEDADAFCAWLSKKEGKIYRLPTDREWSVAVGIPKEKLGSPKSLDGKLEDQWPWGTTFPPADQMGNYADSATLEVFGNEFGNIEEYDDGYAFTAPVMSYPTALSKEGLYDLGGNVWEWTASYWEGQDMLGRDKSLKDSRALRGGSWFSNDPAALLSSSRNNGNPGDRGYNAGFRLVVESGSGG